MIEQNPAQSAALREEKAETGIIDILMMLAKNKKLILGWPIAAALVAFGASFLVPPVYRASVVILPPQQSQGGGAAALLSQIGGAGSLVANATGIKNPNDLYVGMLQSRRIADVLVDKFALRHAYDTESLEKARKKLAMNTSISTGKDSMITVVVEDKRQDQVAGMANGYVEELIKLTKTLAVTEAAQRRLFYERQLDTAKTNLGTAEQALKKALDTRGVVSVDMESRAYVETLGRLRAQLSVKEIEFNAIKAFLTPNNRDYKQVQEELASLRAELGKLENGRGQGAGTDASRQGLENIQLLRDVKYNQTLYELLSKQYEVARLDEAHDAPVVQVLDTAVVPERKVWPQPFPIAISAGVIALFMTLAIAAFKELRTRSLRDPATRQKWSELRAQMTRLG